MLTNNQLLGIDTVTIKNKDAKGNEIIETTKGKILKVLQGDRGGVHAKVFIDGDTVERWVFASDQ